MWLRGLAVTRSFYGLLFSFALELEGVGEVEGGIVKRQAMDGRTAIKGVAVPAQSALRAAHMFFRAVAVFATVLPHLRI
jgi:hypothetical protein